MNYSVTFFCECSVRRVLISIGFFWWNKGEERKVKSSFLCASCNSVLNIFTLLTSSVLLAEVRESPDVSEPHREAHLGQDVLQLAVPRRPAVILGDFYLRDLLPCGRSHVQGAALVIERLLMGEQVGHRLRDVLMALLALHHLAGLRHRGGWGVREEVWGWTERKRRRKKRGQRGSNWEDERNYWQKRSGEKRWMDEDVRKSLKGPVLGASSAFGESETQNVFQNQEQI